MQKMQTEIAVNPFMRTQLAYPPPNPSLQGIARKLRLRAPSALRALAAPELKR